MNIYADSSFIVSLYLSDQHSKKAEALSLSNPDFCLTPLHTAEWAHAVEQHVFRGTLSAQEANQLHNRIAGDAGRFWTQISIPDSAFGRCVALARSYVAQIGLRTLDTLHVAIALELNIPIFWTFDERQRKLAQAVGLKTN